MKQVLDINNNETSFNINDNETSSRYFICIIIVNY